MLPKSLTVSLIPYLVTLATAQTYTSCNPLTQTCDAAPALAGSIYTDFTLGSSNRYEAYLSSDQVSYGNSDGAKFTISQRGDTPTVESDFYIMFGRIEFTVQAAPGTGIISSMVLISDDLDEIDIEWIGGDTSQVQSNFFSKGDTSTYDRGAFHPVDSPQTTMHSYAIDWTSEQTVWYVNGVAVRTLVNPGNGYYPQSPMQVRFGSWAGGDSSNSEGTIEWAGGLTDYSAGPFDFYIKTLSVQDYSTGQEYKYTDHSGAWTAIEAVGGQINGNLDGSNGNIDKSNVVSVEQLTHSVASSPVLPSTPEPSFSVSSDESFSAAPLSTSVYLVPSFTFVASSTVSSSEESSTSVFWAEPPITTLVTETPSGPETSFIITSSWDANSAEASGNYMTFEFTENEDGAASVSTSNEKLRLFFAARVNSVVVNGTANTTATNTLEQTNDSSVSRTFPGLMGIGSMLLVYTFVF